MTVREATADDRPTIHAFVGAMTEEIWRRPFSPPQMTDEWLDEQHLFVAEADGEIVGFAAGRSSDAEPGHLHLIYVKPEHRREGVGKELLRAFVARMGEEGAGHITLDVDTSNTQGIAVWEQLGFTEWARRLSAPTKALEGRLSPTERGESFVSIHVQSDDERAVEQAVRKYVPRFGSSRGTVVAPPRNGWIAVYDELVDGDPKAARRLATELSHATGSVVTAFSLEDGQVVRYLLIDRGSLVDEYLSVPEYYGPLAPGDAIALGSNPTVVARLTGADAPAVRAVARTATAPADLPPARELLAEIAEIFGIDGADHGYDGAESISDGVAISHR